MANYSFNPGSIPDVENGHTFLRDNFTQLYPHTEILAGKTGLIFRNCTLINCDVPAGSVIEHCLHIQISFCTHTRPDLVTRYSYPACAENCDHVYDTDDIIIDGVSVGTIYHYEEKEVE